jgi:hypothetical protein
MDRTWEEKKMVWISSMYLTTPLTTTPPLPPVAPPPLPVCPCVLPPPHIPSPLPIPHTLIPHTHPSASRRYSDPSEDVVRLQSFDVDRFLTIYEQESAKVRRAEKSGDERRRAEMRGRRMLTLSRVCCRRCAVAGVLQWCAVACVVACACSA